MLNLERLRVLHAVSGAGSVRGAAETLHVTTSAISQQLKALEREVGQLLVERRGRGIRLTDAGSVLAEHAGELLAQVERVEADLAERRGAVAGELRLAAFATAARGLMPPILKGLKEKYPALRLRLAELEPLDASRRSAGRTSTSPSCRTGRTHRRARRRASPAGTCWTTSWMWRCRPITRWPAGRT